MPKFSGAAVAAVSFCAALVGLGGTALAADAANGERLARRWCAECHVVAADQTRASADVPSFAALAARPELTDIAITAIFTAPDRAHSRMPAIDLSRPDIADLIAHIRRQGR